jgi:hypothetical protein
MATTDKRLERMRENPKAGWTVEDVRAVCHANGVEFRSPKRGSHCKVTHESQREILTIPQNRPVKAVYIRRLVDFIDAVKDRDS